MYHMLACQPHLTHIFIIFLYNYECTHHQLNIPFSTYACILHGVHLIHFMWNWELMLNSLMLVSFVSKPCPSTRPSVSQRVSVQEEKKNFDKFKSASFLLSDISSELISFDSIQFRPLAGLKPKGKDSVNITWRNV